MTDGLLSRVVVDGEKGKERGEIYSNSVAISSVFSRAVQKWCV